MLIPLHWMSTTAAFTLLGVGGLLLVWLAASTLWFRPSPFQKLALCVLGLFLAAAALDVLKDRTVEWAENGPSHFRVVRNVLSLTLTSVPIALLFLRARRTSRVAAIFLGAFGVLIAAVAALGGVESLQQERQLWIAAARLPGAWLLQRDGNMVTARLLLALGGLSLSAPLVARLLRAWNPARNVPFRPFDGTLLGLGLCSASMAIFFWHQFDESDRFYTYLYMIGTAWLAPMLVLGEGRILTALWARSLLSGLGVLLFLWMLSGLGGMREFDGQWFSNFWIAGLLLTLIGLFLPVLGLHLLVHFGLQARRRAAARKPCPPFK